MKRLIILFTLVVFFGRPPAAHGDWLSDFLASDIPSYFSAEAQASIPFFVRLEDGESPFKAYIPPVLSSLSVTVGAHLLFRTHSLTLDSVALGVGFKFGVLPAAYINWEPPSPWMVAWLEYYPYVRFRFNTVDLRLAVGPAFLNTESEYTVVGLLFAYHNFGIEYEFYWSTKDAVPVYPLDQAKKPGMMMHRVSVGYHYYR